MRRLFFWAIVIAFPLLLLEGLSALYLTQLAPNPRSLAVRNIRWHLYDAYRNHALNPDWKFEGHVHDAQGFRRSGDVSQEKPAGTYRVFLMGGSAAYGLSAPPPFPRAVVTNEQTIDHKMEQLLAPLHPGRRVEVINAGVSAYWTHHHLIYLLESLLDYDPDLVIFLDGINDYYHTNPDHRQFGSYRYSMTMRVGGLNQPTWSDAFRVLVDWAKQHSHAVLLGSRAANRYLRWGDEPSDADLDMPVNPAELTPEYLQRYEAISRRTWVRTLRTILLLLRDEGVAAITTLQPELVFRQTAGVSGDDLRLRGIELGRRPAHYAEKKEFMKPTTRRLAAETAEELGAAFVDLTDVFDDRAQYFVDYCHLSEAGAARLAERLLPHVESAMAAQRERAQHRSGGRAHT